MIKLIWKKELTETFRTGKMLWTTIGVVMLLSLALYNGYSYYAVHSRLLSQSQLTTYEQFINQGDKNPHLGAHFGFYAYKPTADLAMVDNGLEDYTGNSFYLEPHKRGVVRFAEVTDATGLRNFGFFNVAFFVQFFLPLFIFLICHNVFSKEWENGTIKMLLGSNATPFQIFSGKLLACLTIVAAVLLMVAITILILLLTAMPSQLISRTLPAYATWLLGLTVFSTLLTIIGVAVSLLTRSSALALILLSGFWLVGLFLVPRLSAEISRHFYPSITSLDFENATFRKKEYGVNGQGSKDERRAKLKDSVMQHYHVSRLEDLPVFFIPITIEYFEDSDGEIMDNAYDAVEKNENNQDEFVLAGMVISPFLAFRDFSMRVTGTDMRIHNDFTQKAETHRRKVGVLVNDFYQKNTVASNDFWKTVPEFSYTAPGIGWRLAGSVGSLAVLFLWSIASIILMRFSIKRMHM